ncbi:MAG: hypothetical protein J6P79_12335 [Pseudobutyrivibrio sp.]|nr:hypothetical protein [Pseudobutyrivibrio sp.]
MPEVVTTGSTKSKMVCHTAQTNQHKQYEKQNSSPYCPNQLIRAVQKTKWPAILPKEATTGSTKSKNSLQYCPNHKHQAVEKEKICLALP